MNNFLMLATHNANDPNLTQCPCLKCDNWGKCSDCGGAFIKGIDLKYLTWIWDGEGWLVDNSMGVRSLVGQGIGY